MRNNVRFNNHVLDDEVERCSCRKQLRLARQTRPWKHVYLVLLILFVLIYVYRVSDTSFFASTSSSPLPAYPTLEQASDPSLRPLYFPHIPQNTTYLDWTGAGLYSAPQLARALHRLTTTHLCNPHSMSRCSEEAEDVVEEARKRVLEHFNAQGDYDCVFTSGATASLKLVAESLAFTPGSVLALSTDNHQSAQAMRELAATRGAKVTMVPSELLKTDPGGSTNIWAKQASLAAPLGLLVYPAQSNYHGVKYSLDVINALSELRGLSNLGLDPSLNWLTMLDAAAAAPTTKLDLKAHPADFVSLSFYKIFGYPTGLGALLIRREASSHLTRAYHGGGTVVGAGPSAGEGGLWSFLKEKPNVCAKFEDGTVNFYGIAELLDGFDALSALGGVDTVGRHAFSVAQYLAGELASLKHANGHPLVSLAGNWPALLATRPENDLARKEQGAIVNFNLSDAQGAPIGYHEVMQRAVDANVEIRAGTLCNTGASYEQACNVSEDAAAKFIAEKQSCGDSHDVLEGHHMGGLRASLGYSTSKMDADKLIEVVKTFIK